MFYGSHAMLCNKDNIYLIPRFFAASEASLLTAIRLLHSDRNNICSDTGDDRNAWSKVQTNNNKRDTKATSGSTKTVASVIMKSHTTNLVLGSNQIPVQPPKTVQSLSNPRFPSPSAKVINFLSSELSITFT